MSQAFLNGFRASRNMGVGDVRTPMMRSLDQAQTQSGNPSLAYNMPRMAPPGQRPMQAQQMAYRAPMLGPVRSNPTMQMADMPVQGQMNYRNPSGPMFTNLNAGRFGRNRPMNQ